MGRWGFAAALGMVAALMAGCTKYEPFTYGFPGPHETRQYFDRFDFYGHSVEFTVYYPDIAPPPAGCPVVIFSSGWNQPRTTNEAFCQQLAQWGMVVINRQYPSLLRPYVAEHIEHTSMLLDWAIAQSADPASRLFGMIDATKAASAGYSMGAGVAVAAAAVDPRFKAVVSIDPLSGDRASQGSDGLGDLEAAVLYIRSTYPGRFSESADMYDDTPAPVMQVTIVGASHMQFEDRIVALSRFGPMSAFPNGPADAVQTRAIAIRYSVAWLKVYLEGDTTFWSYLKGAEADEDVEAGLVELEQRFTDPE